MRANLDEAELSNSVKSLCDDIADGLWRLPLVIDCCNREAANCGGCIKDISGVVPLRLLK